MPDIRRCTIYGCKSNSRENKTLKFFNFPARDNPLYEIWLSICSESNESIRFQKRPYICSRHFHERDVGFRRLATGAVPALYLKAPPGFAAEENARLAEIAAAQAEKETQMKLINDAVLEWSRRAQHYPETAALCTTRRELRKIATEVRNLLGATLTLNVDDYWLRKFRQSHMCLLDTLDLDESRNKTLDLETIIKELDPNAKLLGEEEIASLVKEEQEKLIQMELNKTNARSGVKRDHSNSGHTKHSSGKKSKIRKNNFEDSLNHIYYGQSRDSTRDDSGVFEIKPERYDSIDLSQESLSGFDGLDESEPAVRSEPIIDSYQQALAHLKPLEDFALRQENYRAIGLLTTLEIIFKSTNRSQ